MSLSDQHILVGDVGGTNTRLAIADISGENIQINQFEKFAGDDFSAFDDIVETYLTHLGTKPAAASFAIAGPIYDGQVQLTNRDWHISDTELISRFGFSTVQLHNDFAAMSRSALSMDDDSFEVIYDSNFSNPKAPVLVAGPGTGFGMGIVLPRSGAPLVLATEGGHQSFSPVTVAECEMLQILRRKYDFVSLELVTSGSGMNAIHEAICIRHNEPYQRLPPAVIRERADAGDIVCQEVCELRGAAIMGAIGDIALATGALGGVVLAGGVSEHLAGYIQAPNSMARFFNRGARSDYIKRISIRLLTNPEAPLYGAAALYRDHT